MTFTYDMATDVGKVRLLVGDSNADTARLTDEEISTALELGGSLAQAAAICCENMAIKKLADPDNGKQIGDYKADPTGTVDGLREMAQRFRDAENNLPAFAIAEENLSSFSELEILQNFILRTEGGL